MYIPKDFMGKICVSNDVIWAKLPNWPSPKCGQKFWANKTGGQRKL